MYQQSLVRRVGRRAAAELRRLSTLWRPTGIVLMYHGIGQPNADPFRLWVSEANFREQMDVLSSLGGCMTVGELTARAGKRSDPQRRIAVTFDDGYRNNFTVAAPILAAKRVPATIFVVSDAIGRERMFWWDYLTRLFLEPGPLPAVLELTVSGEVRSWSLGAGVRYSAAEAAADTDWIPEVKPPRHQRQAVFLDLWRLLSELPAAEAEPLCDAIAAWSGVSRSEHPNEHAMSRDELRQLADMDGIEIGGHTVTHPRLASLPPERQLAEMRDGRLQLEAMIGRPVRTIAYPYGSFTPATAALAHEAGFEAGCTTIKGLVLGQSDIFRLYRFPVGNWDGDAFARRLRQLTIPGLHAPHWREEI